MRTEITQRPPSRLGTRRWAFSMAGRRPGFTLVELVMVMAIMGIIAAIAAPRYASSLGAQRADGAAQRIASDLGHAAAMARSTSSGVSVNFSPQQEGYTIP